MTWYVYFPSHVECRALRVQEGRRSSVGHLFWPVTRDYNLPSHYERSHAISAVPTPPPLPSHGVQATILLPSKEFLHHNARLAPAQMWACTSTAEPVLTFLSTLDMQDFHDEPHDLFQACIMRWKQFNVPPASPCHTEA